MKTQSPSKISTAVQREKKLGLATRDAYGQVLAELGKADPGSSRSTPIFRNRPKAVSSGKLFPIGFLIAVSPKQTWFR